MRPHNHFSRIAIWALAIQFLLQPILLAIPPQSLYAMDLSESFSTAIIGAYSAIEQSADTVLTAILPDSKPSGASVIAETSSNSVAVPSSDSSEPTPLLFIENTGQFGNPDSHNAPRFQLQGANETLWFTSNEVWISQVETISQNPSMTEVSNDHESHPTIVKGNNLRLHFQGANPNAKIEGFNPAESTISYLMGDDSTEWYSSVPVWHGIRYTDLYPGVDLEIDGKNGSWNWRLIVRDSTLAKQNANRVSLLVEGGHLDRISQSTGKLVLTTDGDTSLVPLLNLVNDNGEAIEVIHEAKIQGSTVLAPFSNAVSQLEEASSAELSDPTPPLDNAQLIFSTYFGGSGVPVHENILDLAVDSTGAVYVVGVTYSNDFPITPGAFQTTRIGTERDGFVAKFSSSGQLVYSTYLGGTSDDILLSIDVDGAGNAVVGGWTSSNNYPITSLGWWTGFPTGILTKLNANGSGLVFSTFISGAAITQVQVDPTNETLFVAGTSGVVPGIIPISSGAYQTQIAGGKDGVVIKLNSNATSILYATYIGGSGDDEFGQIRVNDAGETYLSGISKSTDFPVTANAIQSTNNTNWWDAVIVKLNASGTNLAYSTYVGINGKKDVSGAIDIDADGNIYFGADASNGAMTTPGVIKPVIPANDEGHDFYIIKINAAGNIVFATYLGGSKAWEYISAIQNMSDGNLVIFGNTNSYDFPVTPGAFQSVHTEYDPVHPGSWYDMTVTVLNSDATAILYSTYFGGNRSDTGLGIATSSGFYLAGSTSSFDLPLANAYDSTKAGTGYASDAFIAKLGPPPLQEYQISGAGSAGLALTCPIDNHAFDSQGTTSIPINTRTGNNTLGETDIFFSADCTSLHLTRSYSTFNARDVTDSVLVSGTLSPGWYHNYDVRLLFPTDPGGAPATIRLLAPDGSRVPFLDFGNGTYKAYPGVGGSLTRTGNAGSYIYTYTNEDDVKFIFNNSGRLITIDNGKGVFHTLTYDANNRLTKVADASGQRFFVFRYNAQGKLYRVGDQTFSDTNPSNPTGRYVEYSYSSTGGQLVSVRDLRGKVWTYEYSDLSHLNFITARRDPRGTLIVRYLYDSQGRAYLASNGKDETVAQISYNPNGTTVITDGSGREQIHSYDSRGTLAHESNDAGTTSTIFNGNFRPANIFDPLGNLASLIWDTKGINLQTTIDPLENITGYLYDTRNNVTQITNPDGSKSRFVYNTVGAIDPLTNTVIHNPALDQDLLLMQIDNYVPGGAGSDVNLVTRYSYTQYYGTNIGFENWSGGFNTAPDSWTFTASNNNNKINGVSDIVKSGTYAGKITVASNKVPRLEQNIATTIPLTEIRGQTFTFGMWLRTTSANAGRIYLDDGTRTYSSYVTSTGQYQWVTVTKTVSSSATKLVLGIEVAGVNGNVVHFDDASLFKPLVSDPSYAFGLEPANLLRRIDPPGPDICFAYNAFGQRIAVFDNCVDAKPSTGLTTEDLLTAYGYDAVGRLFTSTNPLGRTTRYNYIDVDNNPDEVITNYDAAKAAYQDGQWNLSTRTYRDALGRVVATVTNYNAANLPGTGTPQNMDFDGDGVTDAVLEVSPQAPDLNQITLTRYDAAGRISELVANYWPSQPAYHLNTYNLSTRTFYDASGLVVALVNNYREGDLAGSGTPQAIDFNNDSITDATLEISPEASEYNQISLKSYDSAGRLSVETLAAWPGQPNYYQGTYNLLTAYEYDPAGNVLKTVINYDPTLTDGNGNAYTVSLDLDLNGVAVNIVVDPDNPDRNVITCATYDALNRPQFVRDACVPGQADYLSVGDNLYNLVSYFVYDNLGHQIASVGNYEDNGVSSTDGILELTSERNFITRTYFDGLGRVKYVVHNFQGDVSSPTPPAFNPQNPERNLVTYVIYDAQGRPYAEVHNFWDPNGGTLTSADITAGFPDRNLVLRTYYDARGLVSHQVINFVGDLSSAALPTFDAQAPDRNLITAYSYDLLGRPDVTTAVRGSTLQTQQAEKLVYDALGRITSHIANYDTNPDAGINPVAPYNITTQYTYDQMGRQTTQTDPMLRVQQMVYDALGRTTQAIIDPGTGHLNLTVSNIYDVASRVTQSQNGDGELSTATYDVLSQATSATQYPGSGETLTTASTYDLMGRPVFVTNADGLVTRYQYNNLGQVVRTFENYQGAPVCGVATSDVNVCTQFAYDDAGQQVRVTLGNGSITEYTYNALGLLTKETVNPGPTTVVTEYAYNASGDLITVTQAGGTPNQLVTSYTYDALGHILNVNYAGTTPDVAYTYDSFGNRKTMVDGAGTWNYTYDGLNRLKTVSGPYGNSLTYTYDNNGNRTGLSIPGMSVTYTFDNGNRLDKLTDPFAGGTNAIDYSYDAASRVTGITRPNNVATTNVYDDASRLKSITNGSASTFSYTLNGRGSRIGTLDTLQGGSQYNWHYTYDGLGRVASACSDWNGTTQTCNPTGKQFSFGYDGAGNLLRLDRYDKSTQLVEQVRYVYNGANQIRCEDALDVTSGQFDSTCDDGEFQWQYDAYGNLLFDGETKYTYDTAMQLASVCASPDGQTCTGSQTRYRYNGDGDRVAQEVDPGGTQYERTEYVVDVGVALPTVVAETTKTIDRATGNVISTQPTIRYLHGLGLVAQSNGSSAEYFLNDGLGSVRQMTGNTGTVLMSQTFDPVGNPFAGTGTTQSNFGFGGEQTDDNGLVYLRARYYNPAYGAFFQPDPSNLEMNPYQYALGNPVNFIDPSGLLCLDPNAANMFGAKCDYTEEMPGTGAVIQNLWSWIVDEDARNQALAKDLTHGLDVIAATQRLETVPEEVIDYYVTGDTNTLYTGKEQAFWDDVNLAGGFVYDVSSTVADVATMGVDIVDVINLGDDLLKALGKGGWLDEAAGLADNYIDEAAGAADNYLDEGAGALCHNSFSADTPVATENGDTPISEVEIGDEVLAYNETTGEVGEYTVTDTISHIDEVLIVLVIDGETIYTTPEHPFYTDEDEWKNAEDVYSGERIRSKAGDYGIVTSTRVIRDANQPMYNLTIDEAHTFFVGDGSWLVHNANCRILDESEIERIKDALILPTPEHYPPSNTNILNRRFDHAYRHFREFAFGPEGINPLPNPPATSLRGIQHRDVFRGMIEDIVNDPASQVYYSTRLGKPSYMFRRQIASTSTGATFADIHFYATTASGAEPRGSIATAVFWEMTAPRVRKLLMKGD